MTIETQLSQTIDTETPTGPRRRAAQAADGRRRRWYSSVLARIVLIVVSLLFLLPLYWMISTALKGDHELGSYPPTFFPHHLEWGNFAKAVNAFPFWQFFRNTAIITVLSTLFAAVSNFVVAYGFSCIDWPGRNKVFYVVLATLFLPFPITLIPMFDLWANLGLVNTFVPLIAPQLFASAFYTFLLRQFMLQVPKDMLDAARIDGAGEWRIAWRLVFPSSRPAVIAVAIFAAVGSWNDFLGPLIYLQSPSVQTLSIGMQAFRQSNQNVEYNQLMAASLLVVLPLIILFFVFQRYFVRGIALGGFK